MIERMQTTCKSASSRHWPAAAIISDTYLLKSTVLHKERLEGVFHAGIGGDKYKDITRGTEELVPRFSSVQALEISAAKDSLLEYHVHLND